MTPFSPTDVALEGFRTVREHPKVLVAWALVTLVFSVVTAIILVSSGYGEAVAALNSMAFDGTMQSNPQAMFPIYGQMIKPLLMVLPISLASYALLGGAAFRVVLQPQESALGYIRLGGDELRLFGAFLGVGVIIAAGYLASALAAGVIAGILGVLLAMISPVLVAIPIILVFCGVIAALFYMMVKFSMVGPQTFAERKINIFGSWSLTRGHFRPIAGTIMLAWILAFVVMLLGIVITVAVTAIFDGVGSLMTDMTAPDLTSLGAYFTPGRIAATVVGAIVSAPVTAIFFCPLAVIYRSLTGRGQSGVF